MIWHSPTCSKHLDTRRQPRLARARTNAAIAACPSRIRSSNSVTNTGESASEPRPKGVDRRIAFSLVFFCLAASAAAGATLSGTVVLRDSRIDAVNKQNDFSGVVVSAQPVNPELSSPAAPPAAHATMIQKGKMFTPHILPIMAGTTVDFPNFDPIFHSAFSIYSGQIFDVGLYPPGTSKSVRFTRPGVLRVFCNIHPTMSAIILVLNTPWFLKTAKNGSFEMDVPPGDYELSVFHERATEAALTGLSRRIVVSEHGLRVPPITVSEAGYLVAPHKNKYGRDYPEPPDDQIYHPGMRN
jgi:plastocyanin